MSLPGLSTLLNLVEQGVVPDALVRQGIRQLCAAGLRERSGGVEAARERERGLIQACRTAPIAVATDAANEQHYELPPSFFGLCLGRRRKYSGCYWPEGVADLDAAEAESLRITCEHAQLADGMSILELGCGWGSLTLWMAERYPASRITAVSNSRPQREYIEAECRTRGLANVEVITADMNTFSIDRRFDRVVSVEMFEHMRNHAALLQRAAGWLNPQGRLFVHIFVHGRETYLFDTDGPANWMGRHFFTGGMMPSDQLLYAYPEHMVVSEHWRQSGVHYERTANAWLARMDTSRDAVLPIMEQVYGRDQAGRWLQRWRVFFMACAEMFGYDRGNEWWVSHYLLEPRRG